MIYGKTRVRVPGADGWLLPGGQWRIMHYGSAGAHPSADWFVQERGLDGEWFSHDGEFKTIADAVEYVQESG